MSDEINKLKAENSCLKARIVASEAAIIAVLELHHAEVLHAQKLEQKIMKLGAAR